MAKEQEETIIARWLSGSLSPEESDAFEKSGEVEDYKRIIRATDRFIKPAFAKEALREKVLTAIDRPRGRVIALKKWYYVAAASIAVLFALGLFFNEVSYTAEPGEKLSVILPDGSKVALNAGSRLTRSRFFWSSHRKVALEYGEGFFEVEKGEGFQVVTQTGNIDVLGTKFNIKNRGRIFEVACYEGKVQFEEAVTKSRAILEKGQQIVRLANGFERDTTLGTSPVWLKGQSVFENVPLFQVLEELETQYGYAFDRNGVDISKNFTGSFVHTDLQIALMAVLVPMGIDYEVAEGAKMILLKPGE